jgi:hypothetical protein
MKTRSVLQVAAASLVWAACSSGPPPIKPGSPAFFWAVARESYRTGDLLKTNSTLLELSGTDNEFAARARVWHLVVSAGVMQGLSELEKAYDAGSSISPGLFRKQSAALRGLAASTALEFTQAMFEAQADKTAVVKLAFRFPPGTVAVPPELQIVSRGGALSDEDREKLQREALQRGLILAVSSALGSPDDPAKVEALFRSPDVQVPRATFYFGLAKLLYEGSDLFGPERLARPERQTVMCRQAIHTLETLPESDATRALAAEIQARLTKIPGV